jgi:cytochrome P450
MTQVTLTRFEDVEAAFRHPSLRQALYDEGAVVTQGTLLTLHGEAHLARRRLESRVLKADVFREYEREVVPHAIADALAACVQDGRVDAVAFGRRAAFHLTARLTGIDVAPEQHADLLRLVTKFGEGATLVHSTRDKQAVRAEVREALAELDAKFLRAAIARRRALLEQLASGAIAESALPRDVLTVLLRNEDRLALPPDVVRREVAFFLQAGAHSTSNALAHSLHELFEHGERAPAELSRARRDALFLQRCIHEALRLHPASPVAWRRAVAPCEVAGVALTPEVLLVLDMDAANRDPRVFGTDAKAFIPERALPPGVLPFGVTFGPGLHACMGRDLAAGTVTRGEGERLLGSLTLFAQALLARGARRDPDEPPVPDANTARKNWARYPLVFASEARSEA